MPRFKNFSHALISGYVSLLGNVVYTLVSVPLALRYLSKAEFGLWALTTQVAGYVALVDFGMSGASRILVDYKDNKNGGDYGSIIQTTVIVSLVQGFLILACGLGLAFGLAGLLRVPSNLRNEFTILMIGQSAFLAGNFLTRIFAYMLAAHQRYDITNHAQSALFLVSLAVLWLGFQNGLGIYSMLLSQVVAWIIGSAFSLIWCLRLRLFPAMGCWGRPNWKSFAELFAFGRDIFLFTIGSLLLNASQAILVTRWLGLDTAAIWSICTRTYTLITQIVYRIYDYSCAALAEMMVRREMEKLFSRFRSLVVFSCSLSVIAGIMFAVFNQPFVRLWSRGAIGWTAINDILLAVWLIISVCAHSHTGLVGQTKNFAFLRYLYFFEGLFFLCLAFLTVRWTGVTGLIIASIVSDLLFSLPYGIWRTSRFFGRPWKEVTFEWLRPSFRVATRLIIPAGAALALSRLLPPQPLLAVGVPLLGLFGGWLLIQYGLDEPGRRDIFERLTARFGPSLLWTSAPTRPS